MGANRFGVVGMEVAEMFSGTGTASGKGAWRDFEERESGKMKVVRARCRDD